MKLSSIVLLLMIFPLSSFANQEVTAAGESLTADCSKVSDNIAKASTKDNNGEDKAPDTTGR